MERLVDADDVSFEFDTVCDDCYKEDASLMRYRQHLTIDDIHESGWPLCCECDCELPVLQTYYHEKDH